MVKKICRLYFNSIVFLVSKKQVEISEWTGKLLVL
jgi:hypothetical protein